MARIEINIPDKIAFSTNIPIRISDINQGGHLSWDSMCHIIDEAHIQFWNRMVYQGRGEKGISRIMRDAGIIYKRQAYHGQTLKVEIAVTELTDKGFDLVYRVTEVNSGDEIARAKTSFLCYDYQKQKVVPVPDELRERFLTMV